MKQDGQIIAWITGVQPRLFVFILMLIGDRDAARDVLQETNLTMWEKSAEFVPPADPQDAVWAFEAWAVRVARFKALSHVRDAGRDRHLFDASLMEEIASDAQRESEGVDRWRDALTACVERLPASQQQLLRDRYAGEMSVEAIARRQGRRATAVRQTLHRLRQTLAQCVSRRLAEVEG